MRDFENLQRELSERRISRREFVTRATAMGLAAAIPSIIVSEEAKAASPKRGGKLRQAVRGGATSDSLEGATLVDTHNINTSWQVRSNLTEVTADGDVVGELAESWDASADAKTWTFNLRKGVEFHNGKSLEADDVLYSINLHRGEDSKSGASGVVSAIEEIKADGKGAVIFDLSEGNADFPFLMSDYHLTIGIAGTTGKDWDLGIGTGPFVLSEWDPGVRSATKRNPNYFKEGKPYFDEIETLNVGDVTSRSNALKTDEVDVVEDPDLKTLHLFGKTPGLKVVEAGGNKQYTIPMRTDMPPFDNNDVRLALKYAINRDALLKTILRGHGYVGNDHPIGRANRYLADDIPQREYDIDKAKFHVKQAGLSKLTVDLHAGDIYTGATDAAVLMKEQAAAAGIDLNIVKQPTDGYWSNVWMQEAYSMCYWSGRATEDWMFSTAYAEGAAWNDSFWTHARFNELLKVARAELNDAKRGEMYHEMQQIVRDEGGVAIPIFANFISVMKESVQTPEKTSGVWALDGNKNTERWWFA
jgi:peptide/nickel transport system substrate-binding protein